MQNVMARLKLSLGAILPLLMGLFPWVAIQPETSKIQTSSSQHMRSTPLPELQALGSGSALSVQRVDSEAPAIIVSAAVSYPDTLVQLSPSEGFDRRSFKHFGRYLLEGS